MSNFDISCYCDYAGGMNVSLTPKLEAFIRRKVAQGLYGSASEVVREALRRQMETDGAPPDAPALGELLARLRSLESLLRTRGVAGLHVVGSHARGEAGPDSDVDLLIDPDPRARFHLLDLAAVQHACTEALGLPVDVLTRGGSDPAVLAALERDAVRVF
jgi:putative addiction module CopG family antidote